MSKADILAELPKLTREDRREVVSKIHELDGDDWLDEGELSAEEKSLLEARLAEHELHSHSRSSRCLRLPYTDRQRSPGLALSKARLSA